MESFDNMTPIVGSRRPIFLPAFSDNSSSSSHTPTPPSALSSAASLVSPSRSRRKPAYAFKSPSADDSGPGEWEAGHNSTRTGSALGKHASPHPYERRRTSTSTDASRSSAHKFTPSVKSAMQRHAPLLPLYHPLGPLAQSLPKLDPGLFGLPSSFNIDDGEDQADGEVDPRSGSRSRRAGPKGREDDAQSNGTPNGVDKTAQDVARERNPSPRKRRGGGGAKRKRKDADDADGVFPPPAKRTRNPRGAAANSSVPAAPSPLVGPAVVASDLAEEVPENNGGAPADAEEEAQEEPEVQQTPKRSTRTRKPRARPAKRRDSSGSASAASSVSVSIAATTRAAAAATRPGLPEEAGGVNDPEPEPEPVPQPEPEPESGLGASEPQPQAAVNGVGAHKEADSGRPSGIPTSTRSPIEKLAPSVEKLQQASAAGDLAAAASPRLGGKDVPMNGVTHTPGPRVMSIVSAPPATSAPPPPPPAASAQMQKVPPPRAPPQKEEREEGELSD